MGRYRRGRKVKSRRVQYNRKLKVVSSVLLIIAVVMTVMWVYNIPLALIRIPCVIHSKVNSKFIATLDYIRFTPQSKYLRIKFSYVSFYFVINNKKYRVAVVKFKPGKEVTVGKGVSLSSDKVGNTVFLKIYDNVSKIEYPVGKFISSLPNSAVIHTFLYDACISTGFRNTSLIIDVNTKESILLMVKLRTGESELSKVYRVAPGNHIINITSLFNNYVITAMWHWGPFTFYVIDETAYLRIQDNISLKLLVIVLYAVVVLLLVFSRRLVKSK